MDIAVLVKQSLDVQQLAIDSRTGKIYLDEAPTKAGDIELNAAEEAVRIKERVGGKAVAIMLSCFGSSGRRLKEAREALTRLLAMGIDEALLLLSNQYMDTYSAAKLLSEEIRGKYQLVLAGEGSEDNFSGVLPARVAAELGWPYLSYATSIEVNGEEIKVTRSLEDYDEVVSLRLPAVISVTQEINQPRIPTVLHIMRASKKPIVQKEVQATVEPKVKVREIKALRVERKRIFIEGELEEAIEKLIDALRSEGLLEVRG
jgi:electron transfer flavoprotein beta subunit